MLKMPAKSSRLVYADLLRVLAAFAVVVIHISTRWMPDTQVGSISWAVLCAYDALTRWCVPLFVMLSGAFLLDPDKTVTLRDLFFKYILRVLAALLVWGSVYAVLDHGHTDFHFTWPQIKAALGLVLRGDTHYHLWFLYMILGLYLVTPLLRAMIRGSQRGTLHWFFLLAFLFSSLIPVLRGFFPDLMSPVLRWVNQFELHAVLGYTGYYVAGYYLKHYTLKPPVRRAVYALGILGAAGTFWINHVLSVRQNFFHGDLFVYHSPTVAMMAAAVFLLFRSLPWKPLTGWKRVFSLSASISFGAFLCHDLFIKLLGYFGITSLSIHPILSVPILSAAVFLGSLLLSWAISKIPVVGRLIT